MNKKFKGIAAAAAVVVAISLSVNVLINQTNISIEEFNIILFYLNQF